MGNHNVHIAQRIHHDSTATSADALSSTEASSRQEPASLFFYL